MAIYPNQLNSELKTNPKSWMMLSGKEIYLILEYKQFIRKYFQQQGYTERMVLFQDDAGFNEKIIQYVLEISMFNTKRIVEINLTKENVDAQTSKTLAKLIEKKLTDVIVLITASDLNASATKQSWVKKLDSNGIWTRFYPLRPPQFRDWVLKEFKKRNLNLNSQAMALFIECNQGNMASATQQMNVLQMSWQGEVDSEMLKKVISDNARYSILELVDYIIEQNALHANRSMMRLLEEGVNPNQIFWQLSRLINVLAVLKNCHHSQQQTELRKLSVWATHVPKYVNFFKTFSPKQIDVLLQMTARLEQILHGWHPQAARISNIKSAKPAANMVDSIQTLIALLCKKRLPAVYSLV